MDPQYVSILIEEEEKCQTGDEGLALSWGIPAFAGMTATVGKSAGGLRDCRVAVMDHYLRYAPAQQAVAPRNVREYRILRAEGAAISLHRPGVVSQSYIFSSSRAMIIR